MTTATNAVIQRIGAKTAFVTNHGFRDLLLIGRQDRPSLYDIDVVRAPPLVPRELCYGIVGRLDPAGREIQPLDQAQLVQAAADMRSQGVEAVAVAFLHAYANPAHERAAKAVLEQHLPGVAVCISSDILREFREFERASTVVLNAFLTPVMASYLGSLSARLHDAEMGLGVGRDTPIMVMEAAGGLMTVETALAKPVHTILSGPAGGVVAGAHFASLIGRRQRHHHGCRRHQHRHQPDPQRPAGDDAAGQDRSDPDPAADDRHQRHRRRRRLDRLDRRRRRACASGR